MIKLVVVGVGQMNTANTLLHIYSLNISVRNLWRTSSGYNLYMSVPLTEKTRKKNALIQLFTFYKHMQTTNPHYPNMTSNLYKDEKYIQF